MLHSYPWQKSYEALLSLTSDSSFDQRLLGAAWAIASFPVRGLPTPIAELALVASNAFSCWPDSDGFPAPEGHCKALLSFLPQNRKLELREKVIGLYQAICEQRGPGVVYDKDAAVPDDFELSGANKWEFLYWNIASTDERHIRDKYVRYAQYWLPNFPAEVLLEWIGRHGYQSMWTWEHLPLERLQFKEVGWTHTEISQIKTIDPDWTEVSPETGGALYFDEKDDWQCQQIVATGTWNAPIIVIEHTADLSALSPEVPVGLVLIEGHNRLCRMLNAPVNLRDDRRHRVMLGRVV